MSAPTAAVALAEAIGVLTKELGTIMGGNTLVEHHRHEDGEDFYCIYIHAHGKAFMGRGDTAAYALMEANSERQAFEESLAKANEA